MTGFAAQLESLDQARQESIAILAATRSTRVDEQRFRWLYESNPDGPAVLWSVRDCQTGEMAGFTVCLPRRMLNDGNLVMAWIGADFSILPRFRTLGIALKLRRAAKECIDRGAVDLLYSHPNPKMQLIHEKVGHVRVGRMLRYAKPLRIADKLPETIPQWAATVADVAVERALSFTAAEALHKHQHQVRLIEHLEFNSDYDQLFADAPRDRTILGIRDAAYLDWRYRQYPSRRFELLEADQSGRLRGYLVFLQSNNILFIQDVFASSKEAFMDLVVEVIRLGRKRRLHSLSMGLLEQSAMVGILQRFGFRERPDFSYMFAYAANAELQKSISNPARWLIHVGDRDV